MWIEEAEKEEEEWARQVRRVKGHKGENRTRDERIKESVSGENSEVRSLGSAASVWR